MDLPPYRAPRGFRNGHVQTMWASQVRRVLPVGYRRETLDLPDGDVLDVDRASAPADAAPGGSNRIALVAHGLEGSADRTYVRGMAHALLRRGWDVGAWNLRGCGGAPNRLLRTYHSGATDDLEAVVWHVLAEGYAAVGLVGFSLGGNLTLKYVGDAGADLDPRVVAAVGISVPVDLAGAALEMEKPSRRPYMARFMRSLAAKAQEKAERFPEAPSPAGIGRMRTFREFDAGSRRPSTASRARPTTGRAPRRSPCSVRSACRRCSSTRSTTRSSRRRASLATSRRRCFGSSRRPHGGHVGFVTRGAEYWSETVAGMWLDAALQGLGGWKG